MMVRRFIYRGFVVLLGAAAVPVAARASAMTETARPTQATPFATPEEAGGG